MSRNKFRRLSGVRNRGINPQGFHVSQLKFYVEPEGGEITLDFTAAGETATISQDGTVLYSVQLPASP